MTSLSIAERMDRTRSRTDYLHTRTDVQASEEGRDPLDVLDEQIKAKHDEIAKLMHERNARPKDWDVKARLEATFDALRELQKNYSDLLMVRYDARTDLPSREDSAAFKKAMELIEYYENHSPEHTTSKDADQKGP